jgi:hypothetical protein
MERKQTSRDSLRTALMIIILAMTAACGQSRAEKQPGLKVTDDWFTLAPNIDDFSVEMPGLTSFVAPAQPNTYIFRRGRSAYTLISFPRADDDRGSNEEQLNSYGDTFLKSLVESFQKKGITFPSPTPKRLNLNGVPGLEYSSSESELVYVLRLYLRKNRLYSLTAVVPITERSSAERFLSSFTFDRKAPLQFLETPGPLAPLGDPKVKPQSNNSLDRSGGSVFRIKPGAAKVA